MKALLTPLLVAPLLAQAHSADVPHSHARFGRLFSELLHALTSFDHWGALLAVGLVVGLGLLRARRG